MLHIVSGEVRTFVFIFESILNCFAHSASHARCHSPDEFVTPCLARQARILRLMSVEAALRDGIKVDWTVVIRTVIWVHHLGKSTVYRADVKVIAEEVEEESHYSFVEARKIVPVSAVDLSIS